MNFQEKDYLTVNEIKTLITCEYSHDKSNLICDKLEKGNLYQVRNISNMGEHVVIYFYDVVFCLWYKHDNLSITAQKWYIWKYFYSPAELRQKQIDSIIN